MPKRTKSQRIGDAGQNFVRETVDRHPNWMCRAQDLDFGVDLEAEFATTENDDQQPAGKIMKLQVKSSETATIQDSHIVVTLDRGFLSYSSQFRVPIILIVVEISSKRSWWVWLQEWLLHHEEFLSKTPERVTATVKIPIDQTLEDGLNASWIQIALGLGQASMVLAVRDIVTIATSDDGHHIFLTDALKLMDKLKTTNRTWAFEKIVDYIVALGPNAGLWQSSKYIYPLVVAVEHLGDSFTTGHVLRMVRRGENYSSAGIAGLAKLYDAWPNHAKTLNLPATFKAHGFFEIEWYCAARERYTDLKSIDLWSAFAENRLPETRFGVLQLLWDEGLRTRLYKSWPNRGDRVLLENLVSVNENYANEK